MALALCFLMKNHMNVVANTIASVQPIINEVVCLDYGSTDDSIAVAQRNGATVISVHRFESFSALRNRVLDEVKSGWVLFLEPGELVPETEFEKIKKAMTLDYGGYNCVVVNPNNSYNQVVRLFRNDKRFRYKYRVYETIGESIVDNGYKIGNTDIIIANRMVKQVPLYKKYSEFLEADFNEDPENEKIMHLVALLSADKGDYDKAIKLMQKAYDKVPYERYKNDLEMLKKMRSESGRKTVQKKQDKKQDEAQNKKSNKKSFDKVKIKFADE